MSMFRVTRPYDVCLRVPVLPDGSSEKTVRVEAVDEALAITEAILALDDIGITECALLSVEAVPSSGGR